MTPVSRINLIFVSFHSDEDQDEDEDESEQESAESEQESDSDIEEVYVKPRGKKGKKGAAKKSPKKLPKKNVAAKKVKKPSHPPVGEMFTTAVKRLRDNPRKGSSMAAIKGKLLVSVASLYCLPRPHLLEIFMLKISIENLNVDFLWKVPNTYIETTLKEMFFNYYRFHGRGMGFGYSRICQQNQEVYYGRSCKRRSHPN